MQNHTTTWITAEELAAHLGCSTQTIRKMAALGSIPHIKIGVTYKFNIAAVEAVLAGRSHR